MYHRQCLIALYNRAKEGKACEEYDVHAVNHGVAFVSYIEETQNDNSAAPIFKLADLVNLYSTRLKQLGTDGEQRIHSTKLKDKILGYFQNMEAQRQG